MYPTSITPLVPSAPPHDALQPTAPPLEPPERLQWYHNAGGIFICVSSVLTLILAGLTSVWNLAAVTTVSAMLLLALRYGLLSRKPSAVSRPFFLDQYLLGVFLVPSVLAGVVFVVGLIATGGTVVTSFVIFFLFACTYPAAALALRDDLVGIARPTLLLPHLPAAPSLLHTALHRFIRAIPTSLLARAATPALDADALATAAAATSAHAKYTTPTAENIWLHMLHAGAPSLAIISVLSSVVLTAFFFYVVVGGLLSVTATEYCKWRLFQRYVPAQPTPDVHVAAALLGSRGLLVLALTGASGIATSVLLLSSAGLCATRPSAGTALLFAVTVVLDVYIVLVSQIVVATAHVEDVVLRRRVVMRTAFRKSIVYNLGLLFMRVVPLPFFPVPFVVAGVAAALRAAVACHYGSKFVRRLDRALTEQMTTPV